MVLERDDGSPANDEGRDACAAEAASGGSPATASGSGPAATAAQIVPPIGPDEDADLREFCAPAPRKLLVEAAAAALAGAKMRKQGGSKMDASPSCAGVEGASPSHAEVSVAATDALAKAVQRRQSTSLAAVEGENRCGGSSPPLASPASGVRAGVTEAAYSTLLFMVNCLQQQQDDRARQEFATDDWGQDEHEAMADLRAAEAPAYELPPTEHEEREMDRGVPGGLSQDVKDRIERNRAAAMQRKIDRRVYGPIAPNFSAAKSYGGRRENRVYKRGPESLG